MYYHKALLFGSLNMSPVVQIYRFLHLDFLWFVIVYVKHWFYPKDWNKIWTKDIYRWTLFFFSDTNVSNFKWKSVIQILENEMKSKRN